MHLSCSSFHLATTSAIFCSSSGAPGASLFFLSTSLTPTLVSSSRGWLSYSWSRMPRMALSILSESFLSDGARSRGKPRSCFSRKAWICLMLSRCALISSLRAPISASLSPRRTPIM